MDTLPSGDGGCSQTNYMGATALQAIQVLHSQTSSQPPPTSTPLGATTTDSLTTVSRRTTPLENLQTLSQLQQCTRQGTLDSHISQVTTSASNFQLPPNTLLKRRREC